MSPNVHRESATIYQFPAGGRANVEARRAESEAVAALSLPALPKVVFGGCWYHDAAVEAVEPSGNRAQRPAQ